MTPIHNELSENKKEIDFVWSRMSGAPLKKHPGSLIRVNKTFNKAAC